MSEMGWVLYDMCVTTMHILVRYACQWDDDVQEDRAGMERLFHATGVER